MEDFQHIYCCEGDLFRNESLRVAIFEAREARKDFQSEQVQLRMGGFLSNLHAANVRYHIDCKATFLSPRSIKAEGCGGTNTILNNIYLDSLFNICWKMHEVFVNAGECQ